MKTYFSKIERYTGLFKIIILESMAEGIAAGDRFVKQRAEFVDSMQWEEAKKRVMCGEPEQRDEIRRLAAKLCDIVLEAEPSLSTGYAGLERCEDGFAVMPELALAGEDRCEIRRRRSEETVKPGAGDGAYRIIINTDVPWWADPTTNAAVMGALVMVCQNFGPVEIWIQQGWICNGRKDDGVTLFKLDYAGQFEPAHVAFWVGDKYKDTRFSSYINKGLGRVGIGTSTVPQIPCDLYMHGCWVPDADSHQYKNGDQSAQLAMAAKWIAQKAKGIVFEPNDEALSVS